MCACSGADLSLICDQEPGILAPTYSTRTANATSLRSDRFSDQIRSDQITTPTAPQIMNDPVILHESGHSFEREALEAWHKR